MREGFFPTLECELLRRRHDPGRGEHAPLRVHQRPVQPASTAFGHRLLATRQLPEV